METIIKRAIEGGYIPKPFTAYDVLDPLFWQSLVKACGWTCCGVWNGIGVRPKGHETCSNPFIRRALRFHEINLTEGWDAAITYLTEITK